MPVHVFALAPVSAQRVTGGKCFFYADFKHGSSNCARKDSAYLLSLEEARSVSRIMRNTVVRQRFQENFTIGHALDAGVQQSQHTAVGLGSNQAAKTLLQCQNRLRHLKFREGIAAVVLQSSHTGGHDGVAGNSKG